MNRVIAYFTALVLSAVALAVGVRVVASNTTALDRFKGGGIREDTTATTVDIGPPPAPGQVFVRGSVDKLTAEGAQGAAATIAAPFTLTALERGVGRATIENALVSGRRTSIVWGGGTPLPITGTGGSIDLGGAKVDVDASGAAWTVDGSARALKPGTYRAGAPVAVGATGVGTPRDSVEFTADARTVISAQRGVVVKVPAGALELTGPGKVTATGRLQVRDATTLTPTPGFQFGEGPYTVKLNPVDGRVELDAVLQGPFTKS
ncbi:MAG TPA: hypothetical protein VHF27_11080 [Acidimicrobiales bacterium]|nr:hypothetical protein [Acidimicrobiales bacterium]